MGDEKMQTVYANNACEAFAVEECRYISEREADVLLFTASRRKLGELPREDKSTISLRREAPATFLTTALPYRRCWETRPIREKAWVCCFQCWEPIVSKAKSPWEMHMLVFRTAPLTWIHLKNQVERSTVFLQTGEFNSLNG